MVCLIVGLAIVVMLMIFYEIMHAKYWNITEWIWMELVDLNKTILMTPIPWWKRSLMYVYLTLRKTFAAY